MHEYGLDIIMSIIALIHFLLVDLIKHDFKKALFSTSEQFGICIFQPYPLNLVSFVTKCACFVNKQSWIDVAYITLVALETGICRK